MFNCCGGRLNELRRDILQNDLVGLINGLRWAVEVVMCTIGWSSIVMWKVVFLDSSDSMCMKFCVGSFDKGKWVSAWLAGGDDESESRGVCMEFCNTFSFPFTIQ